MVKLSKNNKKSSKLHYRLSSLSNNPNSPNNTNKSNAKHNLGQKQQEQEIRNVVDRDDVVKTSTPAFVDNFYFFASSSLPDFDGLIEETKTKKKSRKAPLSSSFRSSK